MANENDKPKVESPTIEDRLKALESAAALLTVHELTGLRTILERHGFDSKNGTF